ncbi:MAG: RelA/SpoT family protein [Chloroflexota bacterium]
MTYAELEQAVLRYAPPETLGLIRLAYDVARRAHEGQVRESGDEYIEHPLQTAAILAELHLDAATLSAALLHDVVEDTSITLEEIRAQFGPEVAGLVDGLTKLARIQFRSREEEQVENLRKMFFAMAKDLRVILIKLADRLHNMRTLKYLPDERRRQFARETLDVFAPLAHRLGISAIQWELEDLGLRFSEPEIYRDLALRVAQKRGERERYTEAVIATIRDRVATAGITAEVTGRAKHFFSIYNKMYVRGMDFADIYDLIAVRVIVQTVRDCYATLGLVHTIWKPLPGRFKDYIAMPKSNMYQSLHTTVIGPTGEPFEIQIRTEEMHRIAEYGIAAHWKYKEGNVTDREFEEKLSRIREFLEWDTQERDPNEFMRALRTDLFADEVFVFTPKGDVVDLPAGSGPLDFAYRIHTELGHRCNGAKINGRIVPLDCELQNGDIVEVLTRSQPAPSWDWLNLVKTSQAKNKIRAWFKKELREENIVKGKELLEKEARRQGIDPALALDEKLLQEMAQRYNFQGTDDLWAAVGWGGLTPAQVISRIKEELRRLKKLPEDDLEAILAGIKPKTVVPRPGPGVRVKGLDNVMVRFSRCCNPVPGDDVIGYITRGRGVSVHRADCPNVTHSEPERLVECTWDAGDESATYPVSLEVAGSDRPALLSDILASVADTRTNCASVSARTYRDGLAVVELVLEIRNREHLQYLIQRIMRVRDVYRVSRPSEGA